MTPPAEKTTVVRRASNRVANKPPSVEAKSNPDAMSDKTPNQGESAEVVLKPTVSLGPASMKEMDTDKINSEEETTVLDTTTVATQLFTSPDGSLSNCCDDPAPLPEGATMAEKQEHRKELLAYTEEMFQAYSSMSLDGRNLWLDFTTAFRPQTIRAWPRATASKWVDLLIKRDIMVSVGKRRPLASAIIDLLYRESHISANEENNEIRRAKVTWTNQISHNAMKRYEEEESGHEEIPTNQNRHNKKKDEGTVRTGPTDDPDDDDDGSSSDSDEDWKPNEKKGDNTSRGDNYDDGETEVNDGDKTTNIGADKCGQASISNTYGYQGLSLGVNGLMRAYTKQKQFSGAWDEDLDTSLGIYDTMSIMCQVSNSEKLQAMPVMLTGNALSFYASKARSCSTYEEASDMLKTWYNSAEKKSRILNAWQEMKLSEAMMEKPDSSQVDVFRDFVSRMLSLQKQLDSSYHNDKFLRDRLLTAVDIPEIQAALRDRVPRSSTIAINRVANRLSEKPRTAGSTSVHWTITDEPSANYSLGRAYGGAAKKSPRPPWRTGHRSQGYQREDRRQPQRQQTNRRLSSKWLRSIKGCFVCGQEHMARDRHSREEITAAIRRLKERQPSALLTVADLNYIQEIWLGEGDGQEAEEGTENIVWEDEDGLPENGNEDEADIMIAELDMTEIEEKLANDAYIYGQVTTSGQMYISETYVVTHVNDPTYPSREQFMGVKLDTCANIASVMSIGQFYAYCDEFSWPSRELERSTRGLNGIGGRVDGIGEVTIQIPFKDLHLIITVRFIIVQSKIPSLLSMKDMVDNKLDFSILEKTISHEGLKQKLVFENYFLIHRWDRHTMPYAMYTESELASIHRTFGHPSVKAMTSLMKRAKGSDLDRRTKESIQKIWKGCKVCAVESAAPRRFKLTVGTEEFAFNHKVQVDTMFIQNRPIVHMVDEATHFCAAQFLKRQSTTEIWKSIQRMWIHVYLGPPDYLHVDQGTAYTSSEMKMAASAYGITLREAPIETPGSIGIVERYHAPLKRAYLSIRKDLDKDTSDADCLSMAVFSVNSTMGPEGLCPMLLVYGAIPRPLRTLPAPTQVARAIAIERAQKSVQKEQANRRISYGLKHKSSPKAKEMSKRLRELPAGADVLVYRTTTNRWEGPYKFVSVDNETAVVQMPNARRLFRSTCVKPMNNMSQALVCELTGRSQKAKGTKSELSTNFRESRMKELKGLIENGTFIPISRQVVPQGCRIFGSRFVDEMKKAESGIRKKSRLVAQNYSDEEAGTIATKAPTIQRFSVRLLLTLAVSTPGSTTFSRDVTQAYVQSRTELERQVFIKPPKELNMPEDTILQVVKPLYGIPESGLHWYLTYLDHHLHGLNMQRTTMDPCLLFKRQLGKVCSMVALQVDDSLSWGGEQFLQEEEIAAKEFKCKDRIMLESGVSMDFNGMEVSRHGQVIKCSQEAKVKGLKHAETQKQFASIRAAGQYIGVCTRPDVCAALQLIAPTADETPKKDFKSLNDTIDFLQSTPNEGIRHVPLDLESVRLVLITDASFARAKGERSQLGILILLADVKDNANIIYYASTRCKRVTRSVLAAEVHALVQGFDVAYSIQYTVNEVLGRHVEMEAYVDSRTLFQVVARDGNTQEKRLQIDLSALKESYNRGEMCRLAWIPGRMNAADVLTKPAFGKSSALWSLLTTNKLDMMAIGWARSKLDADGATSVIGNKKAFDMKKDDEDNDDCREKGKSPECK